jgi:ESCRT-II complex subunit VPS22
MCNAIGVDPLAASNVKGKKGEGGNFWTQMLGGDVNDFYFEVAVRVVELCRETRGENGGLIGVQECRERVAKGKGIGGDLKVSEYARVHIHILTKLMVLSDDILRAVKSLEPLGSGFAVINIGSKQMIRSVPKELNTDQATVLEVLQLLGNVTVSMLEVNLHWEKERATTVIEDLLASSHVWVDEQCPEKEYWSPAYLYGNVG